MLIAKSLQYVYAPNINAFSKYDDILKQVKKLVPSDKKKSTIVMLEIGMASTVMAVDLCKCGIRALDVGHLQKSYDWFMQGKSMFESQKNEDEFYGPDL